MIFRDLFYDIAAPETATNFSPQFGFYQKEHAQKSKWIPFSSHDLAGRNILKHSSLTFHSPFPEGGYSDKWANAQPRFGSFYTDFDNKNDPSKAIEEAQQFVSILLNNGTDPRGIHTFVSGSKGAYVLVDSRLFGDASTAGHVLLGHIHKGIALKLIGSFSTADFSVYVAQKKGRLIRTANTQRDNGNYRSKIDTLKFTRMPTAEVLNAMKSPGEAVIYPHDLQPSAFLTQLFDQALETVTAELTAKNTKTSSRSHRTIDEDSIIADGSLPSCLTQFNDGSFLKSPSQLRFNDWSFNVASLVSDLADTDAIAACHGFLEKAPSQTYSTASGKIEKFKEQLIDVRKKEIKGPFCESIRKSLPQPPCEQCQYFKKRIQDVGQFFSMNRGGTYRVHKGENQKEYLSPISNAAALLERMIRTYDSHGKISTLSFEYRIFVRGQSFVYEVTSSDLNDNDKLMTDLLLQSGGLVLFNTKEPRAAVTLLQVARVDAPLKTTLTKYSKIGFIGKSKYVFSNAIVEDGKVTFFDHSIVGDHSKGKLNHYHWADISIEEASLRTAALLEALSKIHELEVILPTFAFAISLPVFHLVKCGKKPYLLLRGLTGDSKTTLALACLSLWGDFSAANSFFTASSTANNLEVEAAQLGQVFFLIDDVKGGHSNAKDFRRIVQNYADGVAKGRLRSDASVILGEAILGLMILTGEDSPFSSESSSVGRGLEIQIEKCRKDFEDFLQVQKISSQMNGVLPHFFAFLQKQDSEQVTTQFHTSIKLFQHSVTAGENKERICSHLALLDVSFKLFSLWAKQDLKWSPQHIEHYQKSHAAALVKIGQQQASSAADATCANLFIEELRSLLGSEKARLKVPVYHSDIPQFDRGTIVGELFAEHNESGHVYIIPKVAFQLVKESIEQQGSSFSFSLKAVAQALNRLGYFKTFDQEKFTKRRRSNRTNSNEQIGSNLDYWVFSKELLGIDTTIDVAKFIKPSLVKE